MVEAGRTGSAVNRRVVLARQPAGLPKAADFSLVEAPLPQPAEGQVLTRTLYLSLDPYMRARMGDVLSYAEPQRVGEVMVGGTVGQVVASCHDDFAPGDFVLGYGGWQDYALAGGQQLRKLDPAAAPLSTALGVLGMPGFTAYVGLLDFGRPQPGETVVVSAASGAVGAVVGQIARIKGARVVGIAGAPEKLAYVTGELGFEAAVSHRSPDLAAELAAACPKGIDVYFENVGGAVLDAVLPLLNQGARVPLCGLIAHYNDIGPQAGPDRLPRFLRTLLSRRVSLQGFIISDHTERHAAFLGDMTRWLVEGRISYREDIVEGLEKAPAAFRGLLEGRNFGKILVRVAPDPTHRA